MSGFGGLVRDPKDWALDWGWVSPLRARRAMQQLENLASQIDTRSSRGDDIAKAWVESLRRTAKYLDPDAQIRKRQQTPEKKALRARGDLR